MQHSGQKALGIWARKLFEFGEAQAIELVLDAGLSVTSLSSAGGFTGVDGSSYRDALYDARSMLRTAADLRAGCLVVVTGGRGSHTRSHARRIVCDALKQLGDAAGELGLHIAVQPLERTTDPRCTYLHTLDATLDVLNQLGHPNVGMVFDSYHLRHEVELASRIAEVTPHIRLVALSDSLGGKLPVRCLPGQGDLPLADLVRRIEAEGYRGGYEIQLPSILAWDVEPSALLHECGIAWRHLGFDLETPAPMTTP